MKRDWIKWAKAAAIRAVKTAAQTALGMLTAAQFMQDVSWPMVASSAALAAVCSLLTSLGGLPEEQEGAGENV